MNYKLIRYYMILFLDLAAAGLIVAILVLLVLPASDASTITKEDQKNTVANTNNVSQDEAPAPAKDTGKYIALTFDDGPTPTVTNRILDALEKNGAHATFFVVGRQVGHDKDLVARAVSIGCEIGNHTWEHKNLTKFKGDGLKKSLQKTANAVRKATGGYEVQLIRPTYGKINERVKKQVQSPLIYWNVDTEDWKSKNVNKIMKRLRGNKIKDGDIILMHDVVSTSADAAEKVIPYLQKRGFTLVTVSELLAKKGIQMQAGKLYYNGR